MILTFIVSRTLDEDIWGIALYSQALVAAAQSIIVFFPLSFNQFIDYKMPEYIIKNEKGRIKGILLYGIKVKLVVGVIISAIYFISALSLVKSQIEYAITIIIFIPNIIMVSQTHLFAAVLKALKKYKAIMIFTLIQRITLLIGVIFLFLFASDQIINLTVYALMHITSILPTLLYKYFIVRKWLKDVEKQKINWDEIKKTLKFGAYFSISTGVQQGYDQTYLGFINYYGSSELIVYNNICNNIMNQARGAFALPTGAIYSDLEQTDQREKMALLFKQQIKYVNLLMCFIMGGLFFFVEIYILILYPPEYLEVVQVFQIFIFIVYFKIVINNYTTIYSVTGLEKKIAVLNTSISVVMGIMAWFGMFYFGFIGIIVSKVLGFMIWSISYWLIANRKLKGFKISVQTLYRQLIELLAIVIFVKYVFKETLLPVIPLDGLKGLVLNIFEYLFPTGWDLTDQVDILVENGLVLLFYILVFLLYVILFRVLTKEDLVRIQNLKLKIPFQERIFIILSKMLRSDKKEKQSETIIVSEHDK